MRVALYCRVSTSEQAIHGLSIEAQEHALTEWAKPYTVVGIYKDEGISARKAPEKRPALQAMLRDVEAGKIDLIVFTKLDRFFRSVGAYYRVQDVLEAHHVAWKAIHEDYETQTASGRLKVNIMLSVAQDEADRTSERIKAVMERKREKGEVLSGNTPFGLSLVDKQLVPNDDIEIVKGFFDFFIDSRSKSGAQRYLMSHGINRGITSVDWMLRNERYRPYVDFDRAQEILKERSARSPRTGRVYLFAGLLRCSECGGALVGMYSKGHTYYQCNRHHRGLKCVSKCWDEKELEKSLLVQIMPQLEEYNLIIGQKKKPSQMPQIKKRLQRLKELYLNDLIQLEDYRTEYEALQARIIEEERQEHQIPTREVKSLLQGYALLNSKNKQIFWKRLCDHVTISPDSNITMSFINR